MLKLTKSENANENYLAKIVQIENIRKHTNADRLLCVNIDGNNVITGSNVEKGSIYVYFPPESKINKDYLSKTNSFRDKSLNVNKEESGFFEENCRVRVMKLRDEMSEGYMVPIETLSVIIGENWQQLKNEVDMEFDTIDGILLVEKYIVKTKAKGASGGSKPRKNISDLIVDNQFKLHITTTHLEKYIENIHHNDIISITDKLHGTSFVAGNVLVYKKFTLMEKLASWLGVQIETSEYKVVTSSRKVIRSVGDKDTSAGVGYYSEPIQEIVGKSIGKLLNKGESVYGEIVGFTPNGGAIQSEYDYGYEPGKYGVFIYRITQTNVDGKIIELPMNMVQERALQLGVEAVPIIFYGKAKDLMPGVLLQANEAGESKWREHFLYRIKNSYVEIGNCKYCKNKVPSEGIVLRIEKLNPIPYKMKQKSFVLKESKAMDNNVGDIESAE